MRTSLHCAVAVVAAQAYLVLAEGTAENRPVETVGLQSIAASRETPQAPRSSPARVTRD